MIFVADEVQCGYGRTGRQIKLTHAIKITISKRTVHAVELAAYTTLAIITGPFACTCITTFAFSCRALWLLQGVPLQFQTPVHVYENVSGVCVQALCLR